jgi:hypothetical protein
VARALRDRHISAVELTQAALARIAALEPRLQAFMHLDAARAIAHAQAIDGLRAAGVNLGPLMGVPVAVKDLFSVDGMPTTAGTRLDVQDLVPPQGSFVASLLRAGCVILGKTRTTEFALGGFNLDRPPPWNPCDVNEPRMTGGSSHGSAVAMAAGLANLALVMAEGFYQQLEHKTRTLLTGIEDAAQRAAIPLLVTQVGSMFGLFFTREKRVINFSQAGQCDSAAFRRFFHLMLERGVYLAPSAYEAGFMSAAHTMEHIESTISAAREAFTAMAARDD